MERFVGCDEKLKDITKNPRIKKIIIEYDDYDRIAIEKGINPHTQKSEPYLEDCWIVALRGLTHTIVDEIIAILNEKQIPKIVCVNCDFKMREYPTTDPVTIKSYICDNCGVRIKIKE